MAMGPSGGLLKRMFNPTMMRNKDKSAAGVVRKPSTIRSAAQKIMGGPKEKSIFGKKYAR